jgi:hypothetical protein
MIQPMSLVVDYLLLYLYSSILVCSCQLMIALLRLTVKSGPTTRALTAMKQADFHGHANSASTQ